MHKNKLNKKEFCNMCNITYKTLQKFIKNEPRIKVKNIIKIADLLKVKVDDLLNIKNKF